MNFKNMTIKSKMLVFFSAAIVVLMAATMLIASSLTKNAFNSHLNSILQVIGNIAADRVLAGLESGDKDEVVSAVNAFANQELFSYISVTDKVGREVFHYRKQGLTKLRVRGGKSIEELEDEMFIEMPVETNENQVGAITIGVSLEERDKFLTSARIATTILSLVVIVIFVIITIFIANMISNSIGGIAKAVNEMAQGNLGERIVNNSNDEIGQLATDLNQMAENLRMLTKRISAAGLEITTASSEILASSEQQASGAAEQAASVAQITATIEEWAITSKQIAENADLVVQAADQTLATSQSGQEAMARLSEGMNQIRTTSEQSAKRIIDLGEKSQQIGDVIQIIDKIADETHLLALNASIEAARAGEAGKGFGVVAIEVKNLAESVVESTQEIRDLIKEIQNSINASVMTTEESTKQVNSGVELAQQNAESLGGIVAMIEQTMESAKQISFSTQQQQSTSEQVVAAMQEISGVSTQSATSAKQVTSSAGELNQLASDLQKAIVIFKLQSNEQPESEVSDSAPKEVPDGKA